MGMMKDESHADDTLKENYDVAEINNIGDYQL